MSARCVAAAVACIQGRKTHHRLISQQVLGPLPVHPKTTDGCWRLHDPQLLMAPEYPQVTAAEASYKSADGNQVTYISRTPMTAQTGPWVGTKSVMGVAHRAVHPVRANSIDQTRRNLEALEAHVDSWHASRHGREGLGGGRGGGKRKGAKGIGGGGGPMCTAGMHADMEGKVWWGVEGGERKGRGQAGEGRGGEGGKGNTGGDIPEVPDSEEGPLMRGELTDNACLVA